MPITDKTTENLTRPAVGQKLRWKSSTEPGPETDQRFCKYLGKICPGELRVAAVVETPQGKRDKWQLQISCNGTLISTGSKPSQFSPYWVHID